MPGMRWQDVGVCEQIAAALVLFLAPVGGIENLPGFPLCQLLPHEQ